MRNGGIVLLMGAAALSACTSLTYQEPTAGDRARVRFVTDSRSPTVLRAYGDPSCQTAEAEWMRLRNGPLINSSPRKLGLPLWSYHDNAAKEVYVESGKPLNLMFYGAEVIQATATTQTVESCAVPWSYSFAPNRDYEVTFHSGGKSCRVSVQEFTGNGDQAHTREVASFDNRLSDRTAGCMAVFKKTRLY